MNTKRARKPRAIEVDLSSSGAYLYAVETAKKERAKPSSSIPGIYLGVIKVVLIWVAFTLLSSL